MKSIITSLFVFMGVFHGFSQKMTQKRFDAHLADVLSVDCDQCFRMTLETTQTKEVVIDMFVEGENSEQVVLLTEMSADSLQVTTKFQPVFKAPDDKLAAHKALSVVLHISLPPNKTLYLSSDLGSVMAKGQFTSLTVELTEGHFDGWLKSSNVTVHTLQGDIDLATNKGHAKLNSRNGTVSQEYLGWGENQVDLKTVNGHIRLRRTEE